MSNTQTPSLAQLAGQKKATTAAPSTTKSAVPPTTKQGHNQTVQNVKNLVLGIVHSLELIDEERDAQKELLEKLDKEHGIPKKVAKKVAKLIHKQNKEEEDNTQNEVDQLYNKLK